MVIGNLNLFRTSTCPEEAYPILVIDANTVLALAFAFQRFQAIARRDAQVIQRFGRVQQIQLLGCDLPEGPGANPPGGLRIDAVEDVFRRRILERPYHRNMITRVPCCPQMTFRPPGSCYRQEAPVGPPGGSDSCYLTRPAPLRQTTCHDGGDLLRAVWASPSFLD